MPTRSLFLGMPDHKDANRSPKKTIATGEQNFEFQVSSETGLADQIRIFDRSERAVKDKSLEEVLSEHKNSAFLIIRNDTILMERYANGYTQNDLHSSFSIGKAFTSAMIGFAIQEGHINSVDDLVKTYIPELDFHEYFDELTLRHLLNQTSGIKYKLTMLGSIYYGNDIWNAIKKIDFSHRPGTHFEYLNVTTQLLGIVITNTTGKSPAAYLEEKIWIPLGMESEAAWNTDRKNDMEKTYCCLNATARDYARFGRFYLHQGNWEGKQLLNKEWVQATTSVDTIKGSRRGYNSCWHIGLQGYEDYMAVGLYKQYIYIYPEKNIIIASLCHREKKKKAELIRWRNVFRQIADQL